MDKENVFDDDSDIECEEKPMLALSGSDIDELEKQLMNTTVHYESEEYSDDDIVYPYDAVEKMDKVLHHEKDTYESEEYSDDDIIYPHRSTSYSSILQQTTNEQWTLVEPGSDKIPKVLPDFNEKVGPTFSVSSCPSPSDFYNEMLPDSLFDYIVICTNTRAHLHFGTPISSSESKESWKPVTREEIKKFFAIIVHIGLICKRSINEYWSTDPYLITPIFYSPE
ncbi:unnamed protein product [Rotaria sp. Silwood1]|nr:unnamed protein product [Rotaria sp. Silwood1]CAF1632209.1 unnamed protein product [Rotaria sp. Silwood1]